MTLPSPSATNALVDDILIETLIFLAEKSRQSFGNILAASHVCTRWRNLALACPELWRRFPFLTRYSAKYLTPDDEAFTAEILRRCGALTLDVGWEHIYSRPLDMITRELRSRDRFRTYQLPLVLADDNWWCMVTRNVESAKTPIASLEELSLLCLGYRDGIRHLPLERLKWLLGETLRVPELRILQLKGVSVDVHELSLPKLEEFDMRILGIPQPGVLTIPPCIFQTLGAHSSIKRFRLHLTDAVKGDITGQLVLPQLSEILLATDYNSLTLLLEHLSIPQCRLIKIMFLESPHPGDPDPSDGEMVLGMTNRIVQRLVIPSQSSSNTLSFLHCEETEVGYVFSPRPHDVPYWSQEPNPDDLTIVMAFPQSDRPRRRAIVCNVVDGWIWASGVEKITCLDLPDDPSVAGEYGDIFRDFIRHPLVSVERLICSLEWARVLTDGEVTAAGKGRYTSVEPPLEIIHEQNLFPVISMSIE